MKPLIEFIFSFFARHKSISSYGIGSLDQFIYEVNNDSPLYTKAYIIPNGVTIGNGFIDYDMQIIIADRLNADATNMDDILSNASDIASDIVSYFSLNNEYQLQFTSSSNYFHEQYADSLTGLVLNIKIQTAFDFDRCIIPINLFYKDHLKWYEALSTWGMTSERWSKI